MISLRQQYGFTALALLIMSSIVGLGLAVVYFYGRYNEVSQKLIAVQQENQINKGQLETYEDQLESISSSRLSGYGVINDNVGKRKLFVSDINAIYITHFDIRSECGTDFNEDKANTTVAYNDIERGIIVALPYNPNWGTSKCRINPYDIGKGGTIFFGRINIVEGGGFGRASWLEFIPQRSIDEALKAAEDDINGVPIVSPTRKAIGKAIVVEYSMAGLGEWGHLEIIGRKYNYRLITTAEKVDLNVLETIAASASLLD